MMALTTIVVDMSFGVYRIILPQSEFDKHKMHRRW